MAKTPTAPKTLQEAIRYFTDPDTCLAFMVELRWPDGVQCPTCHSKEVGFIATRRMWECKAKHPKRQFSVKVGTIMEDSPIGLDKWFAAMWLLANAKNGISSYEIGRALGVTQKTAWFMLHRIRQVLRTGSVEMLGGVGGQVEADETFIGPNLKNVHKRKLEKLKAEKGEAKYYAKAIVAGLLDRHQGRVIAKVVPTVRAEHLMPQIEQHLAHGSELITDALQSYRYPGEKYIHSVINKTEAYVQGHVHTNYMENFWALLKRTIRGTYVNAEPAHLQRYVDEQAFRYNERKHPLGDSGRFMYVLKSIMGRRLTYAALTT